MSIAKAIAEDLKEKYEPKLCISTSCCHDQPKFPVVAWKDIITVSARKLTLATAYTEYYTFTPILTIRTFYNHNVIRVSDHNQEPHFTKLYDITDPNFINEIHEQLDQWLQNQQ